MRRPVRREIVALLDTRETLTDGDTGNVNLLTNGEQVRANDITRLHFGKLVGFNTEFAKDTARLNTRLGQMTCEGLHDATGATLTNCNLNRGIAVGFRRLDLGHAIVGHVKHSHRNGPAILGENASHADLAPDKA
ncbi:hypothetical protein SDC9_208606 [bioreactor metagenome]|uniref:Uncharacterized protein n=1 Tax=bioreactor metagenome TaxID=1076179 RepID=A0A645JMM4_9ZZZZ